MTTHRSPNHDANPNPNPNPNPNAGAAGATKRTSDNNKLWRWYGKSVVLLVPGWGNTRGHACFCYAHAYSLGWGNCTRSCRCARTRNKSLQHGLVLASVHKSMSRSILSYIRLKPLHQQLQHFGSAVPYIHLERGYPVCA